jgi:hypothetical protein
VPGFLRFAVSLVGGVAGAAGLVAFALRDDFGAGGAAGGACLAGGCVAEGRCAGEGAGGSWWRCEVWSWGEVEGAVAVEWGSLREELVVGWEGRLRLLLLVVDWRLLAVHRGVLTVCWSLLLGHRRLLVVHIRVVHRGWP